MRLILSIVIIVIICAGLFGCSKRDNPPVEVKDVVDRDFTAAIQKTKEPDVFAITVRKVNKKVDKKIGGFGVAVDLVLQDSSGKVFAAEEGQGQHYATEVGEVFSAIRVPSVESLTGRVRLVRHGIPPGNYKIEPRVRIFEDGRDKLSGRRYADGGSVAVPAGNSVEIAIK